MIADLLRQRFGGAWRVQALGASEFCDTWQADGNGERLFVKTGGLALEAEADGLQALGGHIRAPVVRGCWRAGGPTVLALEWLELSPARDGRAFGLALASLHAAPAGERFGWHRDNFLGSTLQRNRWCDSWVGFHASERLGALAAQLPALGAAVQRVIDVLPRFFDDGHEPRASLIHGDLWSGNWAALLSGAPVVYDPAVSVSDPEAELAMLELFGSPPDAFWGAYREVMPIAAGYARRRPLYQLYHLLNHALLFGGGYVGQARTMAEGLAGR